MISKAKSISFVKFKNISSIPTAEQVAKINQFTRREFKAEELYVGQLRLAHNAIDRDNERFSEGTLQGFADTSVRKTMLFDHNNRSSRDNAVGKYFDVEIERMPLAQALIEVDKELRLPDGMDEVMIMAPWFYIPREGTAKEDLVKIDAGIFDFASIGFDAENMVRVADNDGNTLYWEYRGKGEMREGSLVYLGAQQGMGVKSADNPDKGISDKSKEVKESMKVLIEKFKGFFKKDFSEANLFEEVKSAVAALVAEKDIEIEKLKGPAADGEAFRKSLVANILKCGALIDEVPTDGEKQAAEGKFIETWPIDRLKATSEKYETAARRKYPDQFSIPTKDEGDREKNQTADASSLVDDAKKRAEAAQKK